MNLASILDGHPNDAPAIFSGGETTTYGDLCAQVAALRGAFIEHGVVRGDRVGLLMASNWYFVVTYFAALGIGAVVVPMNPQSPTAELQRELEQVTPKIMIVGATAQEAFAPISRESVGVHKVFVPEGVHLDHALSFEDLLVRDPAPIVELTKDDLAVLMFTSGTAGSPKAAMLTHGNLQSNIEQMQAHAEGRFEASDVALSALPLFHIYGLNATLGVALAAGALVVLVQRFDPSSSIDTIRERKVTIVAGVPPMYEAWASLPTAEATRRDFESVRIAASGASKLDPTLSVQFLERFGVAIGEGYGLTEASPVVTAAAFTNPRVGTIGLPVVNLQVRLVDEQGHDAVTGDPGEIWVKGPNVFPGYWNDKEATLRALTNDGWLRTGDIAVADTDGYLTIVDREKDLIIVSGFNVYPREVEEVLIQHPGVAEVAVLGVPHPHSGESVKAFVVAKPDRMLEEDELAAFCGRELARYKCPTKFVFVSELPYGMGGKVLRRELR
jgi:long-chain acyl-CoA synthetase